ncbi:hypothetical protein ACJMK2_037902 [Sinanodonta woodiana]|uniref:Ewing's tumor-associated antigen 1 n=1 Tax=Sinanodonta woodiana TaxID=1069815 RepID=A0ABD3WLX2_SINWO
MKTRSKICTMTASPSAKRKMKRNTSNEIGSSTEVFAGIMKTPKTKSRAEAVTPLRDDIMCSQHFDSQADVGWDCNSPDTLRHIQRISNRDGISSDLDNIMKLIIEEEPGQQVRNSESPPLLGVWKHSREMEQGMKHRQQRRTGKRRCRMRHQGASDSLVSRELLQKLTQALEKYSGSEPVCDKMDSNTCSRLAISNDSTTEELGKLHDRSDDLFESVMANDKVDKQKPEQELVTLSETSWSDDELFEDNSFIIKATQYPQDYQKIAGSPVFVCNKRKLSEEGNIGNVKSPRYVAHASSSLVFQDSKLDLIPSKDAQNQQVKNVANKPPTGKIVSVTEQKNHVFSSKTQIGAGADTVINNICKSSNSHSKKDRNIGCGKSVLGQLPSNINHGGLQSVQSSVHSDPITAHKSDSVTKVNGSDLSGVNNPCTVGANSASSLKINTGNSFRKHSTFPGSGRNGSNTGQQCSGTSKQIFMLGTAQNSLSETKDSHYCKSKSSLMKGAHSFDALFNTSNLAGTTGGTCVQYGYKQTLPISHKQNSGVIDKHSSHSSSVGIAKPGNLQKNQMQNINKVTVDTAMKLDYDVVSKKGDSQNNPPSNKENSSKEYGKKPDVKLLEDTSRGQRLDTSLTDELLCQLAEPDEILESQIYQVNKYVSACVDVKKEIMLPKPTNLNSKPSQNFSKLKVNSSYNALKPDSTKVYSFKPTQQVSCLKKQQGLSNSSTFEKKPSQEKKGQCHVADSEDLFLSDDDDVLMEPQILAMLDEAEWMATQQSEKDYSKIKKGNSSEDYHKDAKSQLASRDQLPGSHEVPQHCSQQVTGSQGTSGSQMQCTPEEIEKKRIEAIKRRQERAAKKTSLSLRKR